MAVTLEELNALKQGVENKEIIARLLELDGGKYAFTKRNERYSVVINNDMN